MKQNIRRTTGFDNTPLNVVQQYMMCMGMFGLCAALASGVGETLFGSVKMATAASVAGECAKNGTEILGLKAQLKQSQTHHSDEKGLSNRTHFRDLKNSLLSHHEEVLHDLREAQKEADRDQWEMTNDRFQTMITSASVLLAGAGSIIVEGQLPADRAAPGKT